MFENTFIEKWAVFIAVLISYPGFRLAFIKKTNKPLGIFLIALALIFILHIDGII